MARTELTDEEYLLVASVAEREGWEDLATPPLEPPGPRTLAEQSAVMRFAAAVGPRRAPRAGRREPVDPRWARLAMILVGVVGLAICWFISPERTAVGLVVVGVFCLLALRRRSRRGPGVPMGPSRRHGVALIGRR